MKSREPIPAVTFVIPAYNSEATLPETVRSLQAQSCPNWEAVIVDDGSRDRTLRVARSFAAADKRLRVLRQANAGPSAARNNGVRHARGERIVFLDADDWIASDYLEVMLPLARDERTIAYCGYQRILPSGAACPPDLCPELADDPIVLLAQRCEPAIHCVMAAKSLLESVGLFDEDLRCCEDWDLWLRLARAGARFEPAGKVMAFYRMYFGSLSTLNNSGEREAEIVSVRARSLDPRLPPDAPFRDAILIEDDGSALIDSAARMIALAKPGSPIDPAWFTGAKAAWSNLVAHDPEAVGNGILGEAALADIMQARGLADRIVVSAAPVDPVFASDLRDAFDLTMAKKSAGKFGRYLSVIMDPGNLPPQIDTVPGCDVLVVRDLQNDCALLLPFHTAIDRKDIAIRLIAGSTLAAIVKSSGALRSPRFWSTTLREFIRTASDDPRGLLANRREVTGHAVRAGVAAAMFLGRLPAKVRAVQSLSAPILMIPTVTTSDSHILANTLGLRQITDLLALMRQEGYEPVSLSRLQEMRKGGPSYARKPMAIVFEDWQSACASGLLDKKSGPAAEADVLLTPAEIMRMQSGQTIGSEHGEGVRFGLVLEELPRNTEGALALARTYLRQLRDLNGGDGDIAALSRRQGLDDEILASAGFSPILTGSPRPMRLGAYGNVFPAIECTGAEALGTVVECLRAA